MTLAPAPDDLPALHLLRDPRSQVTILTGAGVSAESGIPTFRGPEGYWTIGSENYLPTEMATLEMFLRRPEEVWKWYLYRFGVCLGAKPNPAHLSIAALERRLGDRFALITQNVDGLHLRAGNSDHRTYQIHGNVNYMRCANDCDERLHPLPRDLLPREKHQPLSEPEQSRLTCANCNGWMRPHVLWFDEFYEERYFRSDSALRVAGSTDLLIIAGTSGATTLPNSIATIVHRRGKPIIDINIEEDVFAEMANATAGGGFIRMKCGEALPVIAALVEDCRPSSS
jgi:NAD-dependent deacetylase